MHDHTDADLLAQWQTGDREAYAVLVARHHGLVQAACRRQAAPGDDEDCLQSVFLILSRKPAAAARAPSLAAWLLRVAWYACDHSRRAAKRRKQAELDAARQPTARITAQPEALDHLDSCLLKLPKKQRTAIAMHYLAGKPAEEVALALGTSRNNTYQLISRGLATLRALLARRGVAITGAALISVLATEAQAATTSAPTAILSSLVTPSTKVLSIAHGASTAMSISAIAPFATAAGLVIAAGSMTLALSVEPQMTPASTQAQTQAQTPPAETATSAPPTTPTDREAIRQRLRAGMVAESLPAPAPDPTTPPTSRATNPDGLRQSAPRRDRPTPNQVPGSDQRREAAQPDSALAAVFKNLETPVDGDFAGLRLEVIRTLCAQSNLILTVSATDEQIAAWNTMGTWHFANTAVYQAARTVCGATADDLQLTISQNGLVLQPRQ